MKQEVLDRLNKLAELKLKAGIDSIPQWADFHNEEYIPRSKSMFAKTEINSEPLLANSTEDEIDDMVLVTSSRREDETMRDRKKFLIELQMLVNDLEIEHAKPSQKQVLFDSGHDVTKGTWLSQPASMRKISKALGMNEDKARTLLKQRGLIQTSPQGWICCLDGLSPNSRTALHKIFAK
jgi:hypothetical protein